MAVNDVPCDYGCNDRAGAMTNIKANVPRTAYRGIVSVWKDNKKVHIAPNSLVADAPVN